ncbi:MAG TPA: 4Fe-4S binding protein [Methanobacteriaceae archaeon]|nr:4Fe-4S binding protein [Methanobacteriaceae archaeon]
MCQFCTEHGAGKKWYLAAQNYAQELASSEGRESYIHNFFKNYRNYDKNVRKVDIARKIPFVRDYVQKKFDTYFNYNHSGQVISLEDAVTICAIPGRVSIIDCPCQKYLLNKTEKKCILFGTTSEIVDNIPEFAPVKDIGAEDAAELLKNLDNSGQVHTVWTFKTPYIGALCNCNGSGCLMFHLKSRYNSPTVIKKGHEVALVDEEICNGCGDCYSICQFNSIFIQDGKAKISVGCHGCGICRNSCSQRAIYLVPRDYNSNSIGINPIEIK